MCKSCCDEYAARTTQRPESWIYHVDPLKTCLGGSIPRHWQVHKQAQGSSIWKYVAVFRLEREQCDEQFEICTIHGLLSPQEIMIVENKLHEYHTKGMKKT